MYDIQGKHNVVNICLDAGIEPTLSSTATVLNQTTIQLQKTYSSVVWNWQLWHGGFITTIKIILTIIRLFLFLMNISENVL